MLAARYESHFQDEQCIITTQGQQLTLGSIPVGEGGLFKSKHTYAFTMQSVILLFVVYCICVCTMLQVSFPYLEIA